MAWFLHFIEQSDPPKHGDFTAACGAPQKNMVPVYGDAGEEFRICPACELAAVKKFRRFRSYLFPAAMLRKKTDSFDGL